MEESAEFSLFIPNHFLLYFLTFTKLWTKYGDRKTIQVHILVKISVLETFELKIVFYTKMSVSMAKCSAAEKTIR